MQYFLDLNLNARVCDFNLSSVLEKNLLDVEDLSLVSISQSYISDFFYYNTVEQSTGKLESKITILEKRRHEIYKKGCMEIYFF